MRVTYETVISELFERFPEICAKYHTEFAYMGDEAPPHLVFGSLLIPTLEYALEIGDLRTILSICAYLEDLAESASVDAGLSNLLSVEIGEWVGGAAYEERLSPWLGSETKRICRYTPGLATQRRALREEERQNRVSNRVAAWIKRTLRR